MKHLTEMYAKCKYKKLLLNIKYRLNMYCVVCAFYIFFIKCMICPKLQILNLYLYWNIKKSNSEYE